MGSMRSARQSLRDEHVAYREHLEHPRRIADSLADAPPDELRRGLDHLSETLVNVLLPHAEREDQLLYDAFTSTPGAPTAGSLIRPDHIELRRLVDEFMKLRPRVKAPLSPRVANDLRRILYSIHAILKLHFAKEEGLYLAFLEEETFRHRGGG